MEVKEQQWKVREELDEFVKTKNRTILYLSYFLNFVIIYIILFLGIIF